MSSRGDCRQKENRQNDDLQEKDQEPNRNDEGACCQTKRQDRATKGRAGPAGREREEARHRRPPRQQNGQNLDLLKTPRRRHFERARQAYRLEAKLGAWLFEWRYRQENGDAG